MSKATYSRRVTGPTCLKRTSPRRHKTVPARRISKKRRPHDITERGRPMIFRDRKDAGEKLAAKLTEYAGRDDVLVLALPRGGVPVAFEVAQRLDAPLDVFLVR